MAIDTQALLEASRLPPRWRQRRSFVVLDLDFGLGQTFLALWQAWLQDSHRCDTLIVVALAAEPLPDEPAARTPPGRAAPALAQRLLDAWPPAVAGWHPLLFDAGRVRLMLRLGPCSALQALRELPLQADAIVLGPPPPPAESRWLAKAVARAATPEASVVAGGLTPAWRADLLSSGFQFDAVAGLEGGPVLTTGRYAPRLRPARSTLSPTLSPTPSSTALPGRAAAREALVIGAGLAGAATAAALGGWGWSTHVLDRQPGPAAGASGNPAGLYHGIVHASDGPHARLFRAAALFAQRCYAPLIANGSVPGGSGGLLRLAEEDLQAMQQRLARQHLPAAHVQALGRAAASARAGVPLPSPAWWYPGGGWLSPVALVQHWLGAPGVSFQGGVEVAAVRRSEAGWQALDPTGRVLAQAGVLVLAGADACPRLLAPHGAADWPLQHSRGQVSGWTAGGSHGLTLPVAGDGYALPLSSDGLLCGATSDLDDPYPAARDSDDAHNFQRLARLTGLAPPLGPPTLRRVGWRLQSGDRLPIVGALAANGTAGRQDARLASLPRTSGLFVLTALGSRGITLAPLMGELVAAQIVGAPSPLDRSLADAVDPARWLVRALRRAAGQAGSR